MDDTTSRLPETHAILAGRWSQEIIDLHVDFNKAMPEFDVANIYLFVCYFGYTQILNTAFVSFDQVVTMNGGWNSGFGKTRWHKLYVYFLYSRLS